MNVCMVGSGYVGLSASVGFASRGNKVICVDIDEKKVDKINRGEPPIYEESIEGMLNDALSKDLLEATTDLESAVSDSSLIFLAVGTPSKEDGSIDLSPVKRSAGDISRAIRGKENYVIVAVKSTVVPGTTEGELIPVLEEKSGKKAGEDFGVCMNPEFLREGKAVFDFLNPDRIVIGELDERSGNGLEKLYQNFDAPILRTGLKEAEMIKYASNAFLATKISFINEIGNICKELGIDVYEVAEGVGMDDRISPCFLRAGAGYGGSCFPKDVRALISKAKETGYSPDLLKEGVQLNEEQPSRMIDLLKKHFGVLENKKIGVLGLSFKPGTDDVRESRAIPVVAKLLEEGADVKAYDPQAIENFREKFPKVDYQDDPQEVLESDATLIMTDWKDFENLSYSGKVIIDGRRIKKAREADVYEGICW